MQISFKLNDFQYTINNKLTVIQACLKNKVDIPRFCFHEKLSIAGNCRMCLVEDLKQVKPIASCAINVSSSMSLYTNTLKVKKARESVLEFLLANHPLDCPICDQGGECDLQDQSLVFGSDRGRFYEFKRSVEDKDCGPLIKTVMNRCIHRTRCVRFSNEIAGTNVLGVTGRGSKMEIGFYVEKLMSNELSGNVIDLCPVGALTSKPFSFTARPWELKSYNSIDVLDSMHSNIRIDVRGTKIMRILPRVNDDINEDWITDRIRFSYDSFRQQRLYDPMTKLESNWIKISWKKSLYLLKKVFFNMITQSSSHVLPLKAYIGEIADVESAFLIRKLLKSFGIYSHNDSFDFRSQYRFNTELKSFQLADICLLVGVNLRVTFPLLNSKIRQINVKNNLPVFCIGPYSNFNYFVKHLSISTSSILSILEGSHWLNFKLNSKSSFNPLVFIDSVLPVNRQILSKYTNLDSANWCGLNIFSLNNTSFYVLNEIGALDLKSNIDFNWPFGIDYFFNYNSFNKFTNFDSNFKIYQGHHGDLGASLSNLILPSTSFIEKNTHYVNIWGVLQKTKKVLFNVGNSRDDWKILNALSEILGLSFNFRNSFDLITDVSRVTPFLLYQSNPTLNFLSSIRYSSFGFFKLNSINSIINNFYLVDSITKNSKLMSLCHNRFKTSSYNFF